MTVETAAHAPANVLIVHWHDLGRYLGAYGHADVASPRLDQLAAEGILFTRAHATAPLCSPSRGSLFTGRYPQSNGLLGLAHHGWEYRSGVRTLPQLLSDFGWYSALFGMQHETSYPKRLGFNEFDVSNSYCEYVVDKLRNWLQHSNAARSGQPFLLTAGFFETHRPYPHDRYEPADSAAVDLPDYLPDTPEVRQDLADFYGSIATADAAVGQILDTLTETGLAENTWVVFFTDHGPAFPRAKSTLYDAGTGIAMIMRPPTGQALEPRVYDELFSGVDLVPTLLGLLGVHVPADIDGVSHAQALLAPDTQARPVRDQVYSAKTYHDSFDPIRAIRTTEYSYIENYVPRPMLDLPWDIEASPSGLAVAPFVKTPRPQRELYDLQADPTETNNLLAGENTQRADAIAADLADQLYNWRQRTGDVIPSDFAGTRIAERYTETYLRIHRTAPTSRSAIAVDRGIEEEAAPPTYPGER
ncbi:sulfatase [Mycobacterium kubicae]|uniref:Sulfatase n=1 Tax=Mycobacterium kubicae TaxID=120959 RepID=A0AAX1JDL5_9MYCO|nr:sulfatase [Mycobacterium kubicae]MCV7097957.1 sulfatase [Mycobacterium kubicae]ORV94605.1 sulfatase [Mycobacterium kubicae]QNI10338.1 sulfatase [Mycobacterium kubicae]QPI38546.1 sulfatase [Mycobacterium kubicae]GFG63643.1 sulfatase [Mycobacterium kubicae]